MMADVVKMASDGAKMLLHLERLEEAGQPITLRWNPDEREWTCESGGMQAGGVSLPGVIEAMCAGAIQWGLERMAERVREHQQGAEVGCG